MSIDSIVKRLRESRISEASDSYEYKFDIPWRECVDFGDDLRAHYRLSHMDYADRIMYAAKEDFNEVDWQDYASGDNRTEDCGILSMVMDFDARGACIITVTTSIILNDEQIEAVKEFLVGQMSDGWGEGFEQREIAAFSYEAEEWVEDEDTGEGYYEYIPTTAYVYGQFWWSDSTHDWDISLLSTPLDKGMPTNESANNRVTPELMDISSEIHQAVEKEVIKYMKSEGFPEDEVKDYTRVDATFQEDNLVIEVGAEVSYDGLMDLCDRLNPIVAHYDKDSYFEPITSGIIGAWISIDALVSLEESTDNHKAEYVCKKVLCDKDGVIEILCYDTVEDEDFEKYIGQVDSPSARKAASLLLRDWKFEVPKEIKNELIGTFGLEDFGYSIEEDNGVVTSKSIEDMKHAIVLFHDRHDDIYVEKLIKAYGIPKGKYILDGLTNKDIKKLYNDIRNRIMEIYGPDYEELNPSIFDAFSLSINESEDLSKTRDLIKKDSIEDLRAELADIRTKMDAAKTPGAIKRWEDLYDLYREEIRSRRMKESGYAYSSYCISTITIEENHGKEVIERERFHFSSKEEADKRYEELIASGQYDEVNKEY